MLEPKVYIIILNWNGWKDTIECLDSIKKLTYINYSIIICDNASSDESKNKINEWLKNNVNIDATLIVNKTNLGFAGGNNVGIKAALKQMDCKYVWILNNDTEVTPNSLCCLVNKMKTDDKIGICGSKLMYFYDRGKIQGYGGKFNSYLGYPSTIVKKEQIGNIDYPIGASMFLSIEFLKNVGLMCEEYFLYFEELDWSLRGKQTGYKIDCADDSIIYHKEGASIGSNSKLSSKSMMADYYLQKNKIKVIKKFYPLHLPLIYLGMLIGVIRRIITGQRKMAKQQLKIIFNSIVCNQ